MTGPNSVRAHRAAATRALAAELGHEIQGGLGFFRLMAERLREGKQLDAEELAALTEELERFSLLSGRLRDLARTPLARSEHTPRAICEAACRLTAPTADPLPLELAIEVEDDVRISCDLDVLARGLAALIDNALEAKATRAGVTVSADDHGARFCVWDDGSGFEPGIERALSWGATTRPGAVGLGLTLALRSARAHGFSLEFERDDAQTRALLLVPARDVQTAHAKLGT